MYLGVCGLLDQSSPYLCVHQMGASLVVGELVWRPASWHKQQQVGRVSYLQIVRLVTATQHGALILIPSNH